MDKCAIQNHVQYKDYMKKYISKKACRTHIKKYTTLISQLKVQYAALEHKYQQAMKDMKTKNDELQKMANTLASTHQPGSYTTTCPDEYKRLQALVKECGKPKCPTCPTCPTCPSVVSPKCPDCPTCPTCTDKHRSITKHPDFPALMQRYHKDIAAAKSQVESEMKKKLNVQCPVWSRDPLFHGIYKLANNNKMTL
jgi:hypothetical protein